MLKKPIIIQTESLMPKLNIIKTIHTAIWLFMSVVIFYLLYAVISNKIDKWIWICIGIVALEGMLLLFFRGVCPLTILARKYSDSTKANFDIYLPNWLAKYTKLIYVTIFIVIIIMLIYRLISTS